MTLTIYEELEQGSPEWLQARCGLMTASELNLILTPTLKIADNEKTRSHVYTLAAQRVTRYVEPSYIGDAMLRGWEDEITARDLYSKHYAPAHEIGGMLRDFGSFKLWCSPDGLVGDKGGIECKSRAQKFQMEVIVKNEVPTEHILQVQAAMLVSGRKHWDYVSYCGGMPMHVIPAEPDERIQAAIVAACEGFEKKVQETIDKYHSVLDKVKVRIDTERPNRDMEVF